MSALTIALKFLREHAVIHHSSHYDCYESLDSLTQTNWLNEALTDLSNTGGYVLPARFTREHNPLVLLIERPTQTMRENQNV